MENKEIKSILDPFFKEAQEKSEVFVNNDIILNKISEKIKVITNNLNNELKNIPALENNNKIIELNSLKARMNGNDIKTLIDLIDNKKQNSLSAENNDFDYNLQLNLDFKININNKEDSYIYNPKSAFITSDEEGLTRKIVNLADKLSEKLANQEVDGKKIIDNVLTSNISYSESFARELTQNLVKKNIKIEKSENMEINREQLSFKIKSFDSENMDNFKKFIINNEAITTSEQMFLDKKSKFYQYPKDESQIKDNKIFIHDYKQFTVTKWSIEGIELPKRNLENIRIYHKKSDIENSWNKFYEILKVYFDPIFIPHNGGILFRIKVKYEIEQLKLKKPQIIFEEWNKEVLKKIAKDLLINFLIDIKIPPDWSSGFGKNIYTNKSIIQLFSNNLNFFFVNNKQIAFYT